MNRDGDLLSRTDNENLRLNVTNPEELRIFEQISLQSIMIDGLDLFLSVHMIKMTDNPKDIFY